MGFVETIRPDAEDYWSAIREHPMVARLGDGTLAEEPFRYWVEQDYVYLVEYARVLASMAAAAPDVETMGQFAELLDTTVSEEMDLHRAYASEFGITEADLEATRPSPTTRAYTDFLVRTATTGSFGDALAALLACEWGFNAVARRLDADGRPDHDQYAQWIATYSSEEFTALNRELQDLLDDTAATASARDRERYRRRFETAAQYEYLFWEAAWEQETWPL